MDTIDVDDSVEIALQELHDDETFIYRAPRLAWTEPCVTCKGFPLWGCKLFGCAEGSDTCFIMCPSCGKKGFAECPTEFNPDHALGALLLQKMGR